MRTALVLATSLIIGSCGGGGGGVADGGSGGAAGTGAGADGGGGAQPDAGPDGGGSSGKWSMGYYASWQAGMYPVGEIEWSGLTHIAIAFYTPDAAGALSVMGGNPQAMAAIVSAAHGAGVKAVASIGGADSAPSLRQATSAGVMSAFVSNLAALIDQGYDGIDIDWEPLEKTDEAAVIAVAQQLRAARPAALLTIPIGAINVNIVPDLTGYRAIAAAYDQLNIMSYGMSGAWQGWNSWHSSALYHTSSATPMSIESTVREYLDAGVPAAKLGIGIGFYGLCYSQPVTAPGQALGGATILASDGTMSYANIMRSYHSEAARRWDDVARVPYLTFGSPHAPDGCTFISYDDAQSIAEKGAYVKDNGLGGVIQWELNEGYLAGAAVGQRNPLLIAIRDGVLR